MNHLNINDIVNIQQEKMKLKNHSFEVILSDCFRRIKKQASMFPNNTFCFYDVPEFMLGYPLYKMEDCIKYLMTNIANSGFKVEYMFPRILIISWKPLPSLTYENSNSKKEEKTTKKKKNDCKPKSNSKSKSGKFILNLDI